MLGALANAATGCMIGSTLGQVIDKHLLVDGHCLSCGHVFDMQAEP